MNNQDEKASTPPDYDVFTQAGVDKLRKTSALYEVTRALEPHFTEHQVTWGILDGQPTQTILYHAIQSMQAGLLEDAALGLVYLLFQKHVYATNKADVKLGTAPERVQSYGGTA